MGQFLPHVRQVIKLIKENKEQLRSEINQKKERNEKECNMKEKKFE